MKQGLLRTAGILGVACLLAGCEESSSPIAQRSRARVVTSGNAPDCERLNLTSDEYGTRIRPTSGPAGARVILSGTTLRGEDGRWAPSDRLEAWWNTETPGGIPVDDGPVVRLARVDDMESCHFEATFAVPDAAPGRYQISVIVWNEDPRDGYGYFLPHDFTVTDD